MFLTARHRFALKSYVIIYAFVRKSRGTRVGVIRFGQLHRLVNDDHCLLNDHGKTPRGREHNRWTVEKNM